jgi:hypothetical protein
MLKRLDCGHVHGAFEGGGIFIDNVRCHDNEDTGFMG